jgi:zinc and cadmium transporter
VFDMGVLTWIVAGGLLMSALALVGGVTLLLDARTQERLVRPLVAFAAGALLGGALLHMIPEAARRDGGGIAAYLWVLAGFSAFLALEQFLHWHHCHRASADCRRPLTYLILLGDGLHNLLGGLAVGAAFLADIRLGITTWLAAAAHEIPQELGDFGILIHGGWSRRQALLFNFLSALTFLVGGLLAYVAAQRFDTLGLLAFAAGNFIYIGASDLVPEVNKHREMKINVVHFSAFVAGVAVLAAIRLARG